MLLDVYQFFLFLYTYLKCQKVSSVIPFGGFIFTSCGLIYVKVDVQSVTWGYFLFLLMCLLLFNMLFTMGLPYLTLKTCNRYDDTNVLDNNTIPKKSEKHNTNE